MHSLILTTAMLATFSLTACALTSQDANEGAVSTGQEISTVNVDPSVLSGTYVVTGADTIPFYSFTFDGRGGYTARGGCRPKSGIQCFAILASAGTYTLSGDYQTAPDATIDLLDTAGKRTTYYCSLEGDKLSLSVERGGPPSVFTKQ
jgi:hypothetical protein